MLLAIALMLSFATFVFHQKKDKIHGADEFSAHTRKEHQKHFISGMHAPFLTEDKKALQLFYQYFGEFSHLLPESVEILRKQQALITPVTIKPLAECPISLTPSTLVLAEGEPLLMGSLKRFIRTINGQAALRIIKHPMVTIITWLFGNY